MRSIPRRRGWAPFVGMALAALTAGSLITFSVIAQRTSLDGMSNDRVIAALPAAGQPPSITIAPIGGTDSDGDGASSAETIDDGGGSIPAAPFLTVAENVEDDASGATTLIANDDDSEAAPSSATGRLGGPFAAEEAFLTRAGGGQHDPADSDSRAGWDGRHDGKHAHKSHEVKPKSKGYGSKNTEWKRKDKRGNRANPARAGNRGRRSHSGADSRSNARPSHAHRSAKSSGSAASRGSRPASASRGSSENRPAASRSKGSSKSRGRGHRKH